MPCPPQPDEPTILITKIATSTSVAVPGTLSYLVTVENVGPGDAIDVQFTDQLPDGPVWSIGSGSNVCSITGNTLSCFAAVVPDGVFEVIEIFGAVDGSFCGTIDNSASIAWEGGTQRGLAIADAEQIEITGCGVATPTRRVRPRRPIRHRGAAVIGRESDGGASARAAAETCRTPAYPNRIRP